MRQTLIKAHVPFPEFNAAFVSTVEFVCGLFLVLGVVTPLASALLAGVIIVAIATTAIRNIKATSPADWLAAFLYLPEVLYLQTCGRIGAVVGVPIGFPRITPTFRPGFGVQREKVLGGEDQNGFGVPYPDKFWAGIAGGVRSVRPNDASSVSLQSRASRAGIENNEVVPNER
jgi:hypothetical protein